MPETLAIEVSIPCHEDALGLESRHPYFEIIGIVGDVKALTKHTVAATLKVSANRIRHVVIEKEPELISVVRHSRVGLGRLISNLTLGERDILNCKVRKLANDLISAVACLEEINDTLDGNASSLEDAPVARHKALLFG